MNSRRHRALPQGRGPLFSVVDGKSSQGQQTVQSAAVTDDEGHNLPAVAFAMRSARILAGCRWIGTIACRAAPALAAASATLA